MPWFVEEEEGRNGEVEEVEGLASLAGGGVGQSML